MFNLKIIGIDEKKCTKCLECVKECPSGLFIKPPTEVGEKREVIFKDSYNRCIFCGHCIAVCPTDAIIFENAEKAFEFPEIKNIASIIDYNNLMKFLRARRSIRRFKSDPVPKEKINAVLEAMRYAPSARNAQCWEYVVISDPEIIKVIKNAVIKMMALLIKVIKYRKILKLFVPKEMKEFIMDPATKIGLDHFFEEINKGEDPALYNAPLLIIICAPDLGSMTGADAGIALTHGMLAAQALDLGTCWIGYAQEALRRFKKTRELLKIPKKMNVNGVLIMGYPAVKYHRTPPREPLKIRWF